MSGPTGNHAIFQVHPTRRCNLRCLHCYSSSGPEVSEELEIGVLRRAVADAAGMGYNVLGVSGGEPLLYKPLRALLEAGREAGMITTVTTNGMLLDKRRIDVLVGAAGLVAISLDGVPESHNRMRADEDAFRVMQSRLAPLRDSGIPFGFIFTLTQHNVHELEWVASFAAKEGAGLLQIHPLEQVGRATLTLEGSTPDCKESAYALLEALRIQGEYAGRMHVQLDIATVPAVKDNPHKVFANGCAGDGGICEKDATAPFAEVLSPLVVEADGTATPLLYSFPRRYALGNLHEEALPIMAERWRCETLPDFRALCRGVYAKVIKRKASPLMNWYEEITRAAEKEADRAGAREDPPAARGAAGRRKRVVRLHSMP